MNNLAIKDDDTITTCDDVIPSNVEEIITNLVELTANVDGLIHLRVDTGNIDLFRTFINYCLVHFSTSMNWKYKAYNTLISDIFTESDEALCILLLENNAEDYTKIHDINKK